ncbi:MAG: ABC transporter permease, partial [Pirellulaceae bacterium]
FTALVGVVFSIVLVNVQGGLFLGLIRKASLLIDRGDADIWVGHKNMHNVDFARDIPRRWVQRVRTVPGVDQAKPLLIGFSEMTLPGGDFESVVVVGVDQSTLLGRAWHIVEGGPAALGHNDGVIVDQCDDDKLQYPRIGEVREIAGTRARVVAKSRGIQGFLVAPYVFTTNERAARFLRKSPDMCSYVLVRLKPGADTQLVCREITRRNPDATVMCRQEFSRVSVNFWMTRTGLGISFGAATLLGLFVGLVMVAQTLYAVVLDRLSEFGTLKAIGASELQIACVLFAQAATLAILGSVIGLAVVTGVHRFFDTPRAPILVPNWLALGSCVLVASVCLISSLLPYLRVRTIDPVIVLQA